MSIAGMIYTVLVSLAAVELIRGVAAARRTRSPYQARPPLDAEHGVFVRGTLEAAFLSGGPARAADSLIAGLHEDGRLVVAGPGVVGITRPTARNAAEQAVIDAHTAAPSGALHWLRVAVMRSGPVQETGEALAGRGLLVRPGRQRKWRRWAATQLFLTFVGFPVAAMLTIAQYANPADPGEFDQVTDGVLQLLPAAAFGMVSSIICLSVTSKQLTVAGRYALREYVASARHLTGAAHLVATRGLAAAHPDLRAQLVAAARIRPVRSVRSVRSVRPVVSGSPYPAPYQYQYQYQYPILPNAGSGAAVWCAASAGCGSGGGGGFACSGGGGGGGGGSACSGGGSACSSGGGGSACSSGGGSSCSSSSGSSSSSGGGSSCSSSGGGGSSCSSSSSSS
ncbi:TIGR04222 domain-containing membrane protein [Streptomyces sp. NPDC003006]